MKAKSYMVIKKTNEDGQEERIEKLHKTIIDHREVFSVTIVEDPNTEKPDYIHIVTKRGFSMDLEYDEDTYLDLADYFREQNLL